MGRQDRSTVTVYKNCIMVVCFYSSHRDGKWPGRLADRAVPVWRRRIRNISELHDRNVALVSNAGDGPVTYLGGDWLTDRCSHRTTDHRTDRRFLRMACTIFCK